MKRAIISIATVFILGAFSIADDADVVSQLRSRIDAFNKRFKRSKVDLFFNQPKYSPGDTAFVRTLYTSASDLKPVAGSQIVYVELFDQQGKRMFRNQILVTNGFSSNTLIIPEDIEPGIYSLVAYSDWMKNMDSSLFFRQEFVITRKGWMEAETPAQALEFYPEGGHLVAGIQNNVLIHSAGARNTRVSIRSGEEEIASVQLDEDGLGELKFVPAMNAQYGGEISSGGLVKKVNLPTAENTGLAMEVSLTTPSTFKVKLTPAQNVDLQKSYFLLVVNNNGILYSKQLTIAAGAALEMELPAEMPAGIGQVLVMDETQTVWADRTIHIGSKSSLSLSIKNLNKNYSTRETGSVEVEVLDKLGNPVQGQFAVRITNHDLFKQTTPRHSIDQLLLYGDINQSFALKGVQDDKSVNRYLISQDCPWLNFARIAEVPKFPALRTLVVSGTASFVQTGKPVGDSTLMMFFLQRQTAGYEVYTNANGEFDCPILFDFPGQDQVFYSATRKGVDLRDITVRLNKTDSVYSFKASPWKTSSSDDIYGAYEIKKDIISASYNFFSKPRNKQDSITNPNFAIEDELQGADMTLKISDYIIFPTMADLIREVLRSVEYRKIRGRDVIRVYTTGKRPTNDTGPLYVIDGVLTKNPVTFLSLKPADVLTIKLIKDSNKLIKFGSLGANGVIIVLTRNASTKAALLQENSFTLDGMAPRSKGQTGSKKWNATTPDLRPCLYWGPHEILDQSGKAQIGFSTSDDVGTYTIEVEGLTADGIPFSMSDTFEVKYTPQ